jgi:hypothetical protein
MHGTEIMTNLPEATNGGSRDEFVQTQTHEIFFIGMTSAIHDSKLSRNKGN